MRCWFSTGCHGHTRSAWSRWRQRAVWIFGHCPWEAVWLCHVAILEAFHHRSMQLGRALGKWNLSTAFDKGCFLQLLPSRIYTFLSNFTESRNACWEVQFWETPTCQVFRKHHEGDFGAIGYRFWEMRQALLFDSKFADSQCMWLWNRNLQ